MRTTLNLVRGLLVTILCVTPFFTTHGATITGNLVDIIGVAAKTNVTITPLSTPTTNGTSLVLSRPITLVSTGGVFTTDLLQGNYRVTIGTNPKDSITIVVPAGTDSYNITQISTNNLSPTTTNVVLSSLLSAKGQLASHNGTNAVTVPVGSHGQVLIVDTNQPSSLSYASVSGIGNYQPASDNLTNWSNISTSQLLTLQPGNANLTNWSTLGTNILGSYTKLSDFQSYTNSTVDIPTNSLSAGQVLAWYPPNIIGTNITGGSGQTYDTNIFLTTNKVGGAAFKSAATWQATNSILTRYGEGNFLQILQTEGTTQGDLWMSAVDWKLRYVGETTDQSDIFTLARLEEITNAINTANSYTLTIGGYSTNYIWAQASNAQYQASNISTNQSQNASNAAISQARSDLQSGTNAAKAYTDSLRAELRNSITNVTGTNLIIDCALTNFTHWRLVLAGHTTVMLTNQYAGANVSWNLEGTNAVSQIRYIVPSGVAWRWLVASNGYCTNYVQGAAFFPSSTNVAIAAQEAQ